MTNRRLFAPLPYWRWVKLPADRALDRSLAEIEKAVTVFMEEARGRIAARPELREAPENFLEGMIAAQENDARLQRRGDRRQRLHAAARRRGHHLAHDGLDDLVDGLAAGDPGELGRGGGRGPRRAALRDGVRDGRVVPLRRGRAARVDAAEAGGADHGSRAAGRHRGRGRPVPAGTRLLLLHRYAGLRGVERARRVPAGALARGEDLEAPDQKSFLAFGAGPRFCPGRNLAFLEAKTALAMIARNFELELDPTAASRSPSCSASR